MEEIVPGNPINFWCCLFVVEADGKRRLAYGYAVSVQERELDWAISTVFETGTYKLRRIIAFLTEPNLESLRATILEGSLRLESTRIREPIEIDCGKLVPRPRVYAVPRSDIARETLQSFSDDLAVVDSLWSLGKGVLLDELIPDSVTEKPERDAVAVRLLSALREETGIRFDGIELSRVGNFEIIRHLSDDCRMDDGVCHALSSPEAGGPSLLVWLEPPLSNRGELQVNCKMFNGGTPWGQNCILDKLLPWSGEAIKFTPLEPFTRYEIHVWSGGEKISFQQMVVLRGINATTHVTGQVRTHVTPWSKKQKEKVRKHVEAVAFDSVSQMAMESTTEDPWREAERESARLAEDWFPSGETGRHFANKDGSNVEALDFLIKLMSRPGITGVVIADPYFDREGVESLLARCGNVKRLRVLASRDAAEKSAFIDSCRSCSAMFPRGLRVLNLETEKGGGQQFHDRYMTIEFGEELEVWTLSNSLSSFAKRYPLLVNRIPRPLAFEVGAYLISLEKGALKDRPDLLAVQIWPPIDPAPEEKRKAAKDGCFPGSDLILKLLAGDSGSDVGQSAAVALINNGLEAHEPSQALLTGLAHWSCRGGPNATHYSIAAEKLPGIARMFIGMIEQHARHSTSRRVLPTLENGGTLSDSLEEVWRLMMYSSPIDLLHGLMPEVCFFSEMLSEGNRPLLIEVLDNTRNFEVFAWIASEADFRSEEGALILLGSKLGCVQALGIWILRDLSKAKNSGTAGPVGLAEHLRRAGVTPWQTFISVAFVWAKSGVWRNLTVAAPINFSDYWPESELQPGDMDRLVALVSTAVPYRAITCVSHMADQCRVNEHASTLRQWCVDQLLSEFPLKRKGTPGIKFEPNDLETMKAVARCVWLLNPGTVGEWYLDEVLGKLDWRSILKPLLWTRDYSSWSKGLEKILMVAKWAMEIADTAPDEQQSQGFRIQTGARIAAILANLGPEAWHHFPDSQGRLAQVSAFVVSCQDDDPEDRAQILGLVSDIRIPGLWRLWMMLHSAKLAGKHAHELMELAEDPSTPVSGRGRGYILSCAASCRTAGDHLAARAPELAPILAEVRLRLDAWQARFVD